MKEEDLQLFFRRFLAVIHIRLWKLARKNTVASIIKLVYFTTNHQHGINSLVCRIYPLSGPDLPWIVYYNQGRQKKRKNQERRNQSECKEYMTKTFPS